MQFIIGTFSNLQDKIRFYDRAPKIMRTKPIYSKLYGISMYLKQRNTPSLNICVI